MQKTSDLQDKLDKLSVQKMGEKTYLRELCGVGLEIFSGEFQDPINLPGFQGKISGLVAEVLGTNPNANLSRDDFWDIRKALETLRDEDSVESVTGMLLAPA